MANDPRLPPAGWFPDPGGSGRLRWWDGDRWSEHTREDLAAATAASDLTRDRVLREERSAARWAGYAAWLYALALPAGALLAWRLLRNMVTTLEAAFANPDAPPPTRAELLGLDEGMLIVAEVFNAVQLGAFLVLLLWVSKAATAAHQLGIPAKRSPGWAVASWFIPVVNFWWPYESLRDLLPDGHPTRRRILLLWLTSLAAGMVILLGFAMMALTEAGPAVTVVGYVAFAGVLLLARSVMADVLAAHEKVAHGQADPGRWPIAL